MKKLPFNSIQNLYSPLIFSAILVFLLSVNVSAQLSIEDYQSNSIQIDNLLRLTVDGNGYSDQTIILFIDGATEGFDSDYDAYKLSGIPAAPQFYSIISCCNLAVNALPPMESDVTVQMGFDVGATTTYTISATDLYTFDPTITIHLFDSIDDVLVDLKSDPIYSFSASPGDISERFKVLFSHEPESLDLKVYLEGPYNGTDMNTDLQATGSIPFFQPYNTAPWNYSGTELVASIPSNAVDWVLVEFRDATAAASANSASMVEQHAAFLMNDGTIRGLDGSSLVEFDGWYSNSIYVVVWHRNHLPVLTNSAVMESGGIYTYDFSTGVGQAYGGALAQNNLGGVYGMMGGDTNADGDINTSDLTAIWDLEAGESGYLSGDANLDGQADNKDKDDVWVSNEGSGSQLPL
ncbi:MAG: hypothetical protein DRJ05_10515 [Bacteroidetes bacterium]|nr:MAG: hypothetical protein DRJ05_10515 [Bacteroidota bacterium]